MEKNIRFTKEDLEKNYTSPCGCPIYTAMKRARIPVRSVSPMFWKFSKKEDGQKIRIEFGPELQKVSDILADACNSVDKKTLALRDSLLGKSFKVSY